MVFAYQRYSLSSLIQPWFFLPKSLDTVKSAHLSHHDSARNGRASDLWWRTTCCKLRHISNKVGLDPVLALCVVPLINLMSNSLHAWQILFGWQAQERNTQQRLNFFNTCAVEIQKHWRGFASRKFVHSFYARKQWLARVMKVKQIVVGGLHPCFLLSPSMPYGTIFMCFMLTCPKSQLGNNDTDSSSKHFQEELDIENAGFALCAPGYYHWPVDGMPYHLFRDWNPPL